MTPKDAQRRLQILRFFDKHGLAATCDAFGASRRTLYRWQAALNAAGGNPAALAAKSSAPKKRRTPNTDPRLVSEIRRLRALYLNLGKAKLHVLLAPWCAKHRIALPSVSAIERIRDGMRRSIVTFLDPVSEIAFAWAIPSKHARHTARALQWRLSVLPPPKTLLSDNGSEFEAEFDQLLQNHGIGRWYTYPNTPKMNAHVERFNRTIQESFVDYHEDLLFTDLALFNRKLADWLVFYNTERPHHTLGQSSPLSFLLKHQPECQRYWTHTRVCKI